MKKLLLLTLLGFSLFANDIIVKKSSCDVYTTVHKLKQILRAKGLNIFATINHSANAKAVGLSMRSAIMVVFGKAQMGTKLMQQDPTTGLDLPLRILVYKDKDDKTKMAYRDGSWLVNKHIVNAPKIIQKMNNALDKITTKAGQCKKD